MKKFQYLLPITIVIIGAIYASPALAFDQEKVATYFQPNNITVDSAGNLNIAWQKIQLGLGGYSLGNRALIFSINGRPTTSSLQNVYSNGAGNGGLAIQYQGGWESGISQPYLGTWDGNCRSFNSFDNYSSASTAPNSNTMQVNQIWDSNANSFVNTSAITASTPIQVTLVDLNHSGCGVDTEFSDSVSFYPNQVSTLFSFQYAYPQDGAIVGNFANWNGVITNNSSSVATGTLIYSFGLSTSTLDLTASTTFSAAPNTNTSISIPNAYQFVTPQMTQPQTWYEQAQIVNASSGVNLTFPPISFTVNPSFSTSQILTFQYPKEGMTTNLFSPYLLTVNGISPTDDYIVKVNWYADEGGGTLTQTLTNVAYGTGQQLLTQGIQVPRTDFGFDLATTTHWYAEADLYDSQDPTNPTADLAQPVFISSANIDFYVLSIPQGNQQFTVPSFIYDDSGNAIAVTNTTTTVASQELITPSSTPIECEAPGSVFGVISNPGQDVAYAGCVTSHFLFDPSPDAQANLNSAIFTFQNTPPISIFFNLQDAITNDIGSSTQNESGESKYDELAFDQNTAFLGDTPIILLTSSSMADFIGQDATNQLFTMISSAMVILFGLYVIARIHGRWNKHSGHQSR